jgi:ribosome maturation factor RimP
LDLDKAAEIERIVAPALEAMGYAPVRVRLSGGQRPVLQVMVERKDAAGITLDDCAEVSRALSALLDVEDPLPGSYSLEVSSPGIDRPLVKPQDFERFAGREAALEMRAPIAGRRRFRGRLLGLAGDRVRIALEEGETSLPLDQIHKAKLVLTDALIAEAARRQGS